MNLLRRGLSVTNENPSAEEMFWALKGVCFDVFPGEVVGIIGRNGAGKSTLLKILSRITEPTTGSAELYGRLASLLEVGTAFFHAELSGRENIYLSGAILGMHRREIKRKFDEIVDFAEVGPFLDTPVKRYSSGMYVRLGFAVAAFLESEILIVDEVLSVGDSEFQKKCLGKMENVAGQGRTVLFVSHNMHAMRSLCTRAIWLDKGSVRDEGSASVIISNYLNTSYSANTERIWSDPSTAPGDERVRLHSIRIRPIHGDPLDPITTLTPFEIEIEYRPLKPGVKINALLVLFNEHGQGIFSSSSPSDLPPQSEILSTSLVRRVCRVPGNLLVSGSYRFSLLLNENETLPLVQIDEILTFEIQDATVSKNANYVKWPGIIHPELMWTTDSLMAAI